MKYSQFLTGAAIAAVANAHATIMHAWINDVDQGLGNTAAGYIRSPPNNNPIKDITSTDMTCNVNNVKTAKTLDVAPGDKITLEWHHDSDSASDDIIAASHIGPLMAYLAPTSSDGAGDVWVKIAEDGYDGKTWAVTTLIANKGKWDVTIPSTLAAGEYLLRGEIIALHEADAAFNVNSARGAQFYMECVQIKVSGTGATSLPAGVAIPGAYSYSDPGVVFNVYGSYTSYTIPGPKVWNGASSGSTTPIASSPAAAPVASSTPAAPIASSSAAGVATSAPATIATSAASVPTSVASDLVPVTSAAPVATSAAAPAVSSSKSACKPKTTTTAAPVPTKSACSAKNSATTLSTVARPAASVGATAVAKYGQCGGKSHTGSTTCASGSTCHVYNDWYSQCI